MFLIDTNILLYAVNSACPEHPASLAVVEQARRGPAPCYTTWGILYEFLRVSTHPRVLGRPWPVAEAWGFVAALLASPHLSILAETERHAEAAARTFEETPLLRGNILHDAHTAILMREHGIRRICTHDTDFHRFPFLEVVDPLR